MSDSEPRRDIQFRQLNLFGKTVFLTGAAIRTTAGMIDKALETVADVVVESERAFRQGRDPNVEDAKIIEERDHR